MLVDNLILTKSLGKGSFGEVFLTKKVNGTELYATKRMNRAEYEKPENNKRLLNEISILQRLKHPNIVKLVEVKKTKSHIYIVTEFCNGGSLSENLNKYIKANRKPFTEEMVQYLMRQLVSAVNYLHKNKIIHRDLKLDNILVNFPSDNDKNNINMLSAQVKLIDFGFATKLRESHNNLTNTILGTPSNMEPHMLGNMEKHRNSKEGYNEKVDIWSLGTLCYEMIVGNLTFFGRSMEDLYQKVKKGDYKLPLWLSKEAVSFLNGMLQYDENRRLSSDDLLKHDFLTKNVKDFQKVDTEQVKGKIHGNIMKVNIRNNDTIWGIFNEEKNDNNINDINPISEEDFVQNAVTMPNTDVTGKIMNNLENKKQENKNKKDISSFAQVNMIKNDTKQNNINNNRIISAKRPIAQNNNIRPNNKPSQIPQTTNPSSHHNFKHHTNKINMKEKNQNDNQINNLENGINNINFGHPFQPQKKENPQKIKRQFTTPETSNQINSINNIFNKQQNLPNYSQMENYLKIQSGALNEFY